MQRLDGLGVELLQRTRGLGDEPERVRASLAKRTFEARLPPQRGVTPPSRRAHGRQRTDAAAWYSGQADGGAEIHQRLGTLGAELEACPLPDAAHVRIDRQHRLAEGETAQGGSRVAADARQLGEIGGPTRVRDAPSSAVEVQGAPVVAEALPGADHLRRGRRGKRLHGRPALEPREIARRDALDLGLLEHHLRNEDRVRIPRPAPRQVAAVVREPCEQGSLHVGNALSAVANQAYGEWMLLRIDDTDPRRNLPGGEQALLRDLEWLGVRWDDGPTRQSERRTRHVEAAAGLGDRFDGVTLLREDGTPTYHLASVVDDVDFGITHIIRGNDHRPNEHLHRRLFEALGATPPEFVYHGLILGPDGRKLSKRAEGATVASLREAGIPSEAVRAYLEELDLPRHDVHLDLARMRRLAIEAIGVLSDEQLAERVGVPLEVVPALRGARDLVEAREYAEAILNAPEPVKVSAVETLARFRELVQRSNGRLDGRSLVRELRAVGGDLRAVRLALTGHEHGPELWAVIAALPRDETLRRIDAAL